MRNGSNWRFSWFHSEYHVYKDGSLRDEILACQNEKGNAYDPFAVNAVIAACHHFLGFLICSTNLLMALVVWRTDLLRARFLFVGGACFYSECRQQIKR